MSSDQSAVSIEERKFILDSDMRRREMALKESESKRGGISAAHATIAGAVIALVSGVAGALITSQSSQNIEAGKSLTSLQIEQLKVQGNLELERSKQTATEALERKKFETSLILEAIKTNSRSDALRNLKFFVAAGFVTDPEKKIAQLSDESLPSISTPSQESAGRALRATGSIATASQGSTPNWVCTAVAISPRHVITADFCVIRAGKSDPTIQLKVAQQTYPLRLISHSEQSRLALLEISSAARLESYLDHSRIREPALGEFVYFAISTPEQGIQLQTCKVIQGGTSENDFHHDCATGGGSAGAVVVAVSDDSLLGIHHSGTVGGNKKEGVASKLKASLPKLSTGISSLDPGPKKQN